MMKSTKQAKHHHFHGFGVDDLPDGFLSPHFLAGILTTGDQSLAKKLKQDYLRGQHIVSGLLWLLVLKWKQINTLVRKTLGTITSRLPTLLKSSLLQSSLLQSSLSQHTCQSLRSLLRKPLRLTTRFLVFLLAILTLLVISAKGSAAEVWQSRQQIIDVATEHALSSPEVESLRHVQVNPGALDSRLKLRRCTMPLETFHPFSSQASHKITVGVSCNDSKPWTIFVPVALTAEYKVITVTRSLPRGARLTTHDLAEKTVRMRPNHKPYISSLEGALGKEVSRSLSAGTSLTHAMVRVPTVISRGDNITLIVSMGALEVRSSATALQDGMVGEKIALINAKSRRKVEGWVQTNGSVRVFR